MIREVISKLEKGEISARELVSKYQDAIKKKDPRLNVYREVFDDAMEEAEKVDKKIKHGDTPRVLEGIPFAINMAATVVSPANNTVSSNMTGTKAGQELKGFPPTFTGQSIAEVQYCKANAHIKPVKPAQKVTYGSQDRFKPAA